MSLSPLLPNRAFLSSSVAADNVVVGGVIRRRTAKAAMISHAENVAGAFSALATSYLSLTNGDLGFAG